MATLNRLPSLLIISFVLAACSSPTATPTAETAVGIPVSVEGGGTYLDIRPAQLADMLKNKDFILVNTHIPYEGELEQTDAFIPFEENGPQRVADYPEDRTAKIVLYCRSGRMSSIVAAELVRAGYTNVWNLEGGMTAWDKAGYVLLMK